MIEAGVLQVLAGGVIGITGGWLLEQQRESTKAKNITAAFMVEIESILELIKARNYVREIEEFLVQIRQTGHPVQMEIPITQPYFEVYLKNTGSIGYLGVYAPEVVRFYHTVFTIVEDLATITRVFKEADLSDHDERLEVGLYQVEFFDEILNQFRKAVSIGSKLMSDYRCDGAVH